MYLKSNTIGENFVDREADVCDNTTSKQRTEDYTMYNQLPDEVIVQDFRNDYPDVDYLSVSKEINDKGEVRYGCAMTFKNCKDEMGKSIMVHLHTSDDHSATNDLWDCLIEAFRRLVYTTGFDPREADKNDYYNNIDLFHTGWETGEVEARESFDLSDDAEALASAGFGTDEDYGGYNDGC